MLSVKLIGSLGASVLLLTGGHPLAAEVAPTPTGPPSTLPSVPTEGPDQPDEYDPDIYADSIDTDVTYDDQVAQTYDDGYDPQAYAQFSDTLSPYGSWVDDPSYGRVWTPSSLIVGADFSPYATNGHWAMTEYGWTWVSGWDWGWAPFHYGRWAMRGGFGWCWIPGTLWGPAWVSWRSGGGYVGWAPLPPRGMGMGRPIGMHSPWRFTAVGHLGAAQPNYLPQRTVPRVFAQTTVVSNRRTLSMNGTAIRVNAGPNRVSAAAPPRLSAIAPRAVPQVAIAPRAGIAVAARPWAQAGIRQQTPIYRAPSSRPVDVPRGSAWAGNSLRPVGGGGRQGFAPPPARATPWTGVPRPTAPSSNYYRPSGPPVTYGPSYRFQGPAYRPAPSIRSYAPQPVYRAPIMNPAPYSFSAPARSFSAPAPSFSTPSRSFSAPSRSFSAPASSFRGGGGGGGSHFGGGGRGRR
jgi:hypothetical protein